MNTEFLYWFIAVIVVCVALFVWMVYKLATVNKDDLEDTEDWTD
jgi:hypothetical protein